MCVGGGEGEAFCGWVELGVGRLEQQEGQVGRHGRGGRQYEKKQLVVPGGWGREGTLSWVCVSLSCSWFDLFFPPIQLALSSSGAYSEEMKREMGRSEELEDPAVYWKPLHFSPQWLETRPERQECPVCKAGISREKVVPLYGRGSQKPQDPR